ncbi:MAG: EscU/YscU/HrcU family type III secretion system export apparatus switch protein [Thiotrichales bacterium]
MSEDKSRKTEKPTHRKLRESRRKGQVAKGKEIVPAAMLIAALVYMWFSWERFLGTAASLVIPGPDVFTREFKPAFGDLLYRSFVMGLLELTLPFVLFLAGVAIVGHLIQFGFIFAVDPIIPRLSKLNPVANAKKIFSVKSLVETTLSLIKIVIITFVVFLIVRAGISELVRDLSGCNKFCFVAVLESMIFKLFLYVVPLLLVLSVIDYIFQKYQFLEEQKMTKEEFKRDMKDTEGDPLIKGYRRGLQREIGADDVAQRVRKARVIVMDIGIAVALEYEKNVTPLPIMTAIGKGNVAQTMIEVARSERILTVADPALVARLVEDGTVDAFIPDSTIDQVAKIIRRAMAQ